jgi:hypothetical protein
MPVTPNYSFRYPASTDPADGPAGIGNLATDVDGVLKTSIWTPLNNRVAALEAIGPPPPAPTKQNGQIDLQTAVGLASGVWTVVLSTPTLAAGTWLLLGKVFVMPTDFSAPGYTTVDLSGAVQGRLASACQEPSGRQTVSLHTLFTTTGAGEVAQLKATNSNGKSTIQPVTDPNPEGHTATILTWIKLG